MKHTNFGVSNFILKKHWKKNELTLHDSAELWVLHISWQSTRPPPAQKKAQPTCSPHTKKQYIFNNIFGSIALFNTKENLLRIIAIKTLNAHVLLCMSFCVWLCASSWSYELEQKYQVLVVTSIIHSQTYSLLNMMYGNQQKSSTKRMKNIKVIREFVEFPTVIFRQFHILPIRMNRTRAKQIGFY